MSKDNITKLRDTIVQNQFINCHSPEFSLEDRKPLVNFLSTLGKEFENIIFSDINIDVFESCDNEEQEANALQALINCELFHKSKEIIEIEAISIADALNKFGNKLDGRVLLAFHLFHDLYNENEKNILRSLRKAIRNKDEISSYLSILIVSNRPVPRWELFPESNLDERHVTFFEY